MLAAISMPTLVLSGAEDEDNGSAEALAELLADGRYVEVPGTHMSASPSRSSAKRSLSFLA